MAKTKRRFDPKDPVQALIDAWQVHNSVSLHLISKIPIDGFSTVPAGSRGRTVGEQLLHVYKNRLGWVEYHRTGKRPKLPRVKNAKTNRRELIQAFTSSGKEVERLIRDAYAETTSVRFFKKRLLRFIGYLIAHESHHRGSILLALRQNNVTMPRQVKDRMWGLWIWS